MKTFLLVSLLAATALSAPNKWGGEAHGGKWLPEVIRERRSPTFGIQKVKTIGHVGYQPVPLIAPPTFIKQTHVYREDEDGKNDSSEEDAPRQCSIKIKEPKTNLEKCKDDDDAQINLVEDQIRHSIDKAMNTITKLKTKLEQMQEEMVAKTTVPAKTTHEAQPSQEQQPEKETQVTEKPQVTEDTQIAEQNPVAEQKQVAEETKAEKETEPTQEATSARMQWKDTEGAADTALMSNIATAKTALDDAQRMFSDMITMNREANPASQGNQDLAKMSESERITHWKNAIENIERNVEIANDMKRSFFPDVDEDKLDAGEAVPAASELNMHVVKPETMPSHAEEKSAEEFMQHEEAMRNTNLQDAEEMSPLNAEVAPFTRGQERMHPHHLHHHHHHGHHFRQPESEAMLAQNLERNDNQHGQSQLMMTPMEDNQSQRSNMQMMPRPLQMPLNNMHQRQMFRMNPAMTEDLHHHMRASPMPDTGRMDSEKQAENLESEAVEGQSQQQMRIPLSRSMHWRPTLAGEAPRSAYGPSVGPLTLNIRRPLLARPNFALGAPSYAAAPAITANNFASQQHSFLADEEGAGESVGVFPSAPGGCSVPLLLSCSPSVVQGSLAQPPPAPVALQAPHRAPAYGAPAVVVNSATAFAGPAYREGEQSSLHSKRDVKAEASSEQPAVNSAETVPAVASSAKIPAVASSAKIPAVASSAKIPAAVSSGKIAAVTSSAKIPAIVASSAPAPVVVGNTSGLEVKTNSKA